MIDIKKKEECCGCYACTNVCPKICIEMKVDEEGFWYPKLMRINVLNVACVKGYAL